MTGRGGDGRGQAALCCQPAGWVWYGECDAGQGRRLGRLQSVVQGRAEGWGDIAEGKESMVQSRTEGRRGQGQGRAGWDRWLYLSLPAPPRPTPQASAVKLGDGDVCEASKVQVDPRLEPAVRQDLLSRTLLMSQQVDLDGPAISRVLAAAYEAVTRAGILMAE